MRAASMLKRVSPTAMISEGFRRMCSNTKLDGSICGFFLADSQVSVRLTCSGRSYPFDCEHRFRGKWVGLGGNEFSTGAGNKT